MPEWGGVPAAAPEGKEAVDADFSASSSPSSFFARRRNQHVEAEERPDSDPDTTPVPPARKPPVVLGPDGKPCRACNSKLAFGSALRAASRSSTNTSSAPVPPQDDCPPDVEELGRATWTFLHSAAAYYPNEPSDIQRRSMRALLDALPHVYPCSVCADDLGRAYATSDIASEHARERAVQSGPGLRRWLCEVHNQVNEKLGKPVWDCNDVKRLAFRWFEPPEEREC